MILNSFEINKVLFTILDFPTLLNAMTMDPPGYTIYRHIDVKTGIIRTLVITK